jgi:hypothetical protein
MTETKFAIVTPSYTPDFHRCSLLARSVKEFVDPSIRHYIIVERRELNLFAGLSGPRTDVLTVESLLPPWLFRLPLVRRWWMSLRSKPVRNWIMQQIVKLAVPTQLSEEVLLYVDSDNAFVRPFHGEMFMRGDRVRLYRASGEGDIESQYPWHHTAAKLLGLPVQDYFGARYIGAIPTWRRSTVLRLHKQIERVSSRPWMEAVAGCWQFSEFVLYGVYCDYVLGAASGHYDDPTNVCLEHWDNRPLAGERLSEFFAALEPAHVAVMISARAGMDVKRYEDLMRLHEQHTVANA